VKHGGPAILLALALSSCGGASEQPGPSFTLDVDPPAGTECIGAAGFEVSVTVGGHQAAKETALGTSAVLTEKGCRLSTPLSFSGIDPAASLDVTVQGFDGVHQLLVTGAAHVGSLDQPSGAHVALSGAGVSGHPVLVIDRKAGFPGIDLSAVTAVNIRSQQANLTYLDTPISSAARSFFSVGEPGPMVLGQSPGPGEQLVVTLTLSRGGPKSARFGVTPDASGLFLRASPL
jgi:hypothetical protein